MTSSRATAAITLRRTPQEGHARTSTSAASPSPAAAGDAHHSTFRGGVARLVGLPPGYRAQSKTLTVKDAEQAIFNIDLAPR